MRVFRLSRARYKDGLSGKGAALHGQRWNSKGVEVIYLAESRALANSEVTVHIPLGFLPRDYYMLEVDIPDEVGVQRLAPGSLPRDWNVLPHKPESQQVGDAFVSKNEAAVLQVPSVVVPGDHNYLVNPRHPDFAKIKIVRADPFPLDPRYFFDPDAE